MHVDLYFLSKVHFFWRVLPSIGAVCLQQKIEVGVVYQKSTFLFAIYAPHPRKPSVPHRSQECRLGTTHLMGPCGSTWAHMSPNWAHMNPNWVIWKHADSFRNFATPLDGDYFSHFRSQSVFADYNYKGMVGDFFLPFRHGYSHDIWSRTGRKQKQQNANKVSKQKQTNRRLGV